MKYVLDSGIFMNVQVIPEIDGEFYLSSIILDEIQNSQTKHIFDLFSEEKKISIVDPSTSSIAQIQSTCKKIGQNKLSQADLDVLALGLELQTSGPVSIITDDYAIKNVAKYLKIECYGIKTRGGKQLRKYNYICSSCHSNYTNDLQDCEICGNNSYIKKIRYRKN
ncbi:MAG: hypothetical protein INQ03_07500 [Candidatus Heimdallarchaeota archaeon]|nr:hypothetical protein [Candidatus Heimdallarchaeota archaeon]